MKGIGRAISVRRWGLLGLMLMGLYCGCKKEDHESPAVALSAPADGFGTLADSLFTIAGQANDDQGLSSVTATLYETATELIVQSKTVNVSGLRANFNFEMAAGDRYTTTGDYTLRVTALDLAGNLGAAFTLVGIQELPLAYLGAAWAGDAGSGSFVLNALDTAGQIHTGPSGLAQIADMLVDNRNGQLVAVQSAPGWLRGWDIQSLDPVFQVDVAQGTGSTTFTGVSMNRNKYFASLAVPSYVRSYRYDGASVSDFGDAMHPATAIYAANDRVYACVQGVLGSPLKLDAYNASSDALQTTQVLDWPAEVIAPLGNDRLLVGGNLSGNGQLLVLDQQSLVRGHDLALADPLVGAATANGRAWVITTTGLYEFFPSSGTLSGVLAAGSYGAIAVDATLNRVFLGGSNVVEMRSGAGSLIRSYAGAFGEVKFIDIRYNK